MQKFTSLLICYIIFMSVTMSYIILDMENTEINSVYDLSNEQGHYVYFNSEESMKKFIQSGSIAGKDYEFINNSLRFYAPTSNIGLDSVNDNYIKNLIVNEENNYDITYTINNEYDISYGVMIKAKKGISGFEDSYYLKYNEDSNSLQLIYGASNVVSSLLWTNVIETINNVDLSGQHNIRIVWNVDDNLLYVYLDNVLKISGYKMEKTNNFDYFGGLILYPTKLNQVAYIDLVSITSEYNVNVLDSNSDFLGVISQLILWNVDSKYLPILWNILLVKLPILMLIVSLAYYVRGVE